MAYISLKYSDMNARKMIPENVLYRSDFRRK